MISTLKKVEKEDWPMAHTDHALDAFFKALPVHSQVELLLESEDVLAALKECQTMDRQHVDIVSNVSLPQWSNFLSAWKNKEIQVQFRKFNENVGQEFILRRMVAIWEA
jgi:hypothetical protein